MVSIVQGLIKVKDLKKSAVSLRAPDLLNILWTVLIRKCCVFFPSCCLLSSPPPLLIKDFHKVRMT